MKRIALLLLCTCFAATGLVSCKRKPLKNRQENQQFLQESSANLPILAEVPEFRLTNQHGQSFSSKSLVGKPYLAAFMFTRCPSICPRLTARMKEIDSFMVEHQIPLNLVSISVDPEFDDPVALSAYAQKYNADPARWKFLTGDSKTIAHTAEQGFKVGLSGTVDKARPHLGITHASHLILVDAHGRIRAYFRSSEEDVSNQILAALRKLGSSATP
jgi:protein SCO1